MRRRPAFTLVEMMVATALVLFIMVMLTQAFGIGIQVFTQLKGLGDMEDRLRIAGAVMRRDLSAYHFDGTRRLSDPNFFQNGPPPQGFFRIWQGSPSLPYILNGNQVTPPSYEGIDANFIPSVRTTDRTLHFTVQLSGNSRSDFFVTNISSDPSNTLGTYLSPDYPPDSHYQDPGTYTSQTIEVAYFLRANGNTTTQGGTPLYTLYRRQLLTVPNNTSYNWTPYTNGRFAGSLPGLLDIWSNSAYAEVSCKPNPDSAQPNPPYIYFNNAADLTIPERRFGMDQNQPGGVPMAQIATTIGGVPTTWYTYPTLAPDVATAANYPSFPFFPSLANSDALLEDVLSFDVKVYNGGSFSDIPINPPPGNNSLFDAAPTAAAPYPVRVFDTWTNASDPTTTAPPASDAYDYSGWSSATPGPRVIPWQTSIPAVQITIRLWDKKTQQSRQMTFVQDM